MSETINVAFTANSSEVEAAAARVAASVKSVERVAKSARIQLPEMALTSGTLQTMERAAFLQQDLARKTYMAGSSGKAGALGFLAFSQAVEDAQYGMRGVLNNIPQMILGFGGGAGLAGVLSLAAVAGYQAFRMFQKLSGATDEKNFAKAAEEWERIYTSGMKAADAIRDTAAAQELYNRTLALESQYLNDRIQLQSQMGGYYDQQLATRKRQIAAEQEIYQLALRNASAAGGDTGPIVEQQFTSRRSDLAEELANRQKELANVQDELLRQTQVRENLVAESGDAEIARQERVLALTKEKAALEADIAFSTKRVESGKDANMGLNAARQTYLAERNNLQIYKERLAEVDDELRMVEAAEKGAAEARQKAISSLTESIDALNAKTNRTYQEAEALKEQQTQLEKVITLERQYLEIQKNLKQIESLKGRQQTLKQQESDLKDALKTAEEVQKRTRDTAADIEETQLRQQDTLFKGRGFAANEADFRDIARKAEDIAEKTTFQEGPVRKELLRQQELQKLIDDNTGSVRDRGEARRAAREAEREENRNVRRRDAALKRENEKRKREGKDPIDQPVDDAREALRKAEADRAKAAEAREKNAQEQLKTQQAIEKLLAKIEPKLPAAALGN